MTVDLHSETRRCGVDAASAAARRVIDALVQSGDMSDIADRLNAVADDLEETAPPRNDRLVNMWARPAPTGRSSRTM